MRGMLGLERVHSAGALEGAGHEGTPVGWELRVAGLFVIFAASMCSLITLWFKSTDSAIPRLLRAFSGGIITSLAVVHVIPEAIEQLGNLPVHIPIPLGPCAILFGIIALVVSDSVLSSFLAPESYKQQLQAEHNTNIAQRKTGFFTCGHLNVEPAVAAEAVAAMQKLRHAISAVTMELGCIFHSVIIGIGVGVINNDRHLVLTLITALAIHQGLEGLALGSVLALTNFSMLKKVFMLFLYSITTPVGIAVGIAVASTYDAEGLVNRTVQGSLNGVSGGMLLYIGLHQLIAEEFSKADLTVRPGLRFGMFLALILGAAAMCALALWT